MPGGQLHTTELYTGVIMQQLNCCRCLKEGATFLNLMCDYSHSLVSPFWKQVVKSIGEWSIKHWDSLLPPGITKQ